MNMESSYLFGLVGIGGPWVEFIGFLPRVWFFEVPITNSNVVKLFWMNSMLVLRNCCKKENVRFFKGNSVKIW